MTFNTADLSDQLDARAAVAAPLFRDYGGHNAFHNPVQTIKCCEHNSLVREELSRPGRGRVLVVDAGGPLRHARRSAAAE